MNYVSFRPPRPLLPAIQLICDMARLRAYVCGFPDSLPPGVLTHVPWEIMGPLERVLNELDSALGKRWAGVANAGALATPTTTSTDT